VLGPCKKQNGKRRNRIHAVNKPLLFAQREHLRIDMEKRYCRSAVSFRRISGRSLGRIDTFLSGKDMEKS
jgi:hypothetical protein